jgi:hypothetical protein
MKIRPLGAKLYHAVGRTDRQADMTELIVVLRNFANESKKWNYSIISMFLTFFKHIISFIIKKCLVVLHM